MTEISCRQAVRVSRGKSHVTKYGHARPISSIYTMKWFKLLQKLNTTNLYTHIYLCLFNIFVYYKKSLRIVSSCSIYIYIYIYILQDDFRKRAPARGHSGRGVWGTDPGETADRSEPLWRHNGRYEGGHGSLRGCAEVRRR